ncbi:MAG: GDPmannose 4,6-dehydratase [Blastocatellia bacterium]|jgi:GDPmannose 4,6-dehydratase|nr:GDPmannose 4,6-dehydratase [Blastocatellia bacterium]
MNAIIFGANGQDGYYLGELCRAKGIEPIEVSRSGNGVRGDVSSYEQTEHLIKKYRPAYVFHLAANSTTQHDALFENHETISTGTLNILEAVKSHSPSARVFITGSGVQFRNTGQPISEDQEFEATSPYSVARIQSVYAARYYRALGLSVYVGYLFHHESPMRQPRHVSQKIALAVKRIAEGSRDILELGDISVEKEWTFAGDVANGILTLVEQNAVFEAVIGSGVAYSIENWLDECFGVIGKDWRDHVRCREGFTAEYKRLLSNPRTMKSLGWSPSVNFSDLAAMMISAKESEAFFPKS